jgi:hypothetical protein
MAEVRLGKFEMDAERLPTICIRCGQPSSVMRERRFQSNSTDLTTLLLFGPVMTHLLGMSQSKAITIKVPFCTAHRNHWFGRSLAVYLSLAAILCGGLALVFWAASTKDVRAGDDAWLGGVCVGFGVTMLMWIIVAAIVQGTAIRVREITDNSITLKGVSDTFVAALKESRKNAREIDDETPSLKRPSPRMDIEEGELDDED